VDVIRVSKRLSFVLRHRPDSIGIALDDAARMAADGWALTRSANGVWLVSEVPPRFLGPAQG
jgi:putative RNA 2'-phosphotransferase